MRISIIAALFLVACGETGPYKCDVPWGSFSADVPVDCDAVRYNFNMAKLLLTTPPLQGPPWDPNTTYDFEQDPHYPQHPIMSVREFDEIYAQTPVHLLATKTFHNGSQELLGSYEWLKGITLGREDRALGHEMLHHYETTHWKFDTAGHVNWVEKGYYDIDFAYVYFRRMP